MAISAYLQGKLKKNPLLGTSFAVDPNRAEERQNFMSLYGEAKKRAGEGRAGMLGTLSERYKKLGGPEAERLDVIKSKLGQIQTEAEALKSPERFADVQKRLDQLESLRTQAESVNWDIYGKYGEWPPKQPAEGIMGVGQEYIASVTPQQPEAQYTPAETEYGKFLSEWAQQEGSGSYLHPGPTTLTPQTYFEQTYMPREQGVAQSAYDKLLESTNARLAELGATAKPLTQESIQRQGYLSNLANLYNMFLGAG